MTQDTAPVRRNVVLHLNEISAVEGNYGPQWKLSGDVSALPGQSGNWGKFPSLFWIDNNGTQIQIGPYPCIIERQGKNKPEYSGDVEWHYRWKMLSFNATSAVPQAPQRTESTPPDLSGTMPQGTGWAVVPSTPNPQPRTLPTESDADRRERTTRDSIHRQVSLKAAVDFTIAYSEIALPDPVTFLLGLHETLYARLNAEAPLVGVKAIAPGNVARKTEPLPQEQAAHLDAIAQEEPTPLFAEGPDALKDVGDLFTMTYRTWGKSTAEIMEALGVTKAGDIQPPFKARYDELGAKFSEETA